MLLQVPLSLLRLLSLPVHSAQCNALIHEEPIQGSLREIILALLSQFDSFSPSFGSPEHFTLLPQNKAHWVVICSTQACVSHTFMDRGQDFLILICCGPCIEKQPGKPCLIIIDSKGLYQVSCYIFLCIQMKSQEKGIQSHLQPLFPLRIPWFAGKASLLRPWSFGWVCKAERYGKGTNAPNSAARPLFHHPTPRPRKAYCKNLKEREMCLWSGQCSL